MIHMKAYITRSILGVFAFDSEGSLIDSITFNKDPEEVAEKLAKPENILIQEEKELIKRMEGYTIVLEKETQIEGYTIQNPHIGGETLRENIHEYAQKIGISKTEFREFSHKVNTILTKKKMRTEHQEKDKLLAQAIEAMDDVDESLNLLTERIREWYSIHFPEMDTFIENSQKYTKLILEHGKRDNFKDELKTLAEESMGAEIGENDLKTLQAFAERIDSLYLFREDLESYIDSSMNEIAPNLRALVGASLGARLISLAGGIQELSRMPASRIQVIGAKKALFAHLKKKGKPPKHGIIFQHGTINKSPWWQRGKIARALSAKIAIATRIDAFSGEFRGDQLKDNFLKRYNEIKKTFPNQPKKMRIIRIKKTRKRR